MSNGIRAKFPLLCAAGIALIVAFIFYFSCRNSNSRLHIVAMDHYARPIWSLPSKIAMTIEQYKNRFGEYPKSVSEAETALGNGIANENPFYAMITDKEHVEFRCYTSKIGMSLGPFYYSIFPPKIWRQYSVIRTFSLPDEQEKLLMQHSYDVQDKISPGNFGYFPVFSSQGRCVGYFITMYDIPGGPMLYRGREKGKGKSGQFKLVPQDLYYWTELNPPQLRPEISLYWIDGTQREITLTQVWYFAYALDHNIAEMP